MRALKAFVIGMAVLLSIGVTVVVVAIIQRAQDVGEPAPDATPEVSLPAFDTSRLTLPAGSEIVDMVAEGDRLVLRLKRLDGGEQLVFIDMRSGRTLGTLSVERQP
jgi:hypothetical protein